MATKKRQQKPPQKFNQLGRKILAECEEFILLEASPDYYEDSPRLEMKGAVSTAYWKTVIRKNEGRESTTPEERERLQMALTTFHHSAWGNRLKKSATLDDINSKNAQVVVWNLIEALGDRIIEIAESEDAEVKISECSNLFKTALKYFNDFNQIENRASQGSMPKEFYLIEEAKALFLATHRRPFKSELIEIMKAKGRRFSGNDPKRDWDQLFLRAGLSQLAESP